MHLLFDIIIAVIITGGLGLIYFFWFSSYSEKAYFNKTKKQTLTLLSLITIGIIGYGSFIESQIITTEKYTLTITDNQQNEPLAKIAVIADLHLGPYVKGNILKKINAQIEQIDPDIIVMPGDFIFNDERNAVYLKDLKQITEKYPTYAIWGNHDFNAGRNQDLEYQINRTEIAQKIFDEIKIQSINNKAILLNHANMPYWLMGIDEIWTDRADYEKAFADIPESDKSPRILMVHNPDAIKEINKQNKKIDLLIAGHTHGGQIRLPFLGPVPPLPTILGRKYDQGELEYKNYKLFISSGIGMMGTRARLFNPPEISVLTIY